MEFFLRPAGGRLGPVADSGLVLPVGECHEVYGERTGRARQNFLRRRRQLVKLVRTLASQEMDGRCTTMRLWDKCESSIGMLQNDVRGLSDVQAKTDHKIATVVTGLKEVTEGLAEVRSHMLGQFWASMQGMRGAGGLPLASTGAARHPTTIDGEIEDLRGALPRLDLLEQACVVWEDTMQTEAVKRGELAGEVNRLQMELEALRRDGVQGSHTPHDVQDSIKDAIRGGALSDAVDAMKEVMKQEITPVLKRVQGIEVHAHVNTVKLDQRLADLESEVVKAGGLDSVREGLKQVQQKVAAMWQTVYGSEVARGKEAVFSGLTQTDLNGCKGLVKDWDADRDRWVVEDGGKKILVKAGNTFVKDGHVARLAILEQAAYSEWADGSDGSDG